MLKCEGSYPLFKQNAEIERKLRKTGTLQQVLDFYEKTEFDRLFRDQYPGMTYYLGSWLSNERYEFTISRNMNKNRNDIEIPYIYEQLAPLENYIAGNKEICIVPKKIQANDVMYHYALIYVRFLGSAQWRVLSYLDQEDLPTLRALLPELREHTKLPEFSYYSINKYSDLGK